jgi:hypothetical protein
MADEVGFFSENGELLGSLNKDGIFRISVEVELQPGDMRLAELPMLISLGLYIMLLIQRDSTSASAAISASY